MFLLCFFEYFSWSRFYGLFLHNIQHNSNTFLIHHRPYSLWNKVCIGQYVIRGPCTLSQGNNKPEEGVDHYFFHVSWHEIFKKVELCTLISIVKMVQKIKRSNAVFEMRCRGKWWLLWYFLLHMFADKTC